VETAKSYDLETEDRGGYLYAIVGGLRVTPEIALGYWADIIRECENIGVKKILLEHNFVEMISMPEMLEVIGPVAELLKGYTFAFVERQGHYDVPEAGRKILRSLDVKMRNFPDVHEAERWLLAN
jgi:hypothetical protein